MTKTIEGGVAEFEAAASPDDDDDDDDDIQPAQKPGGLLFDVLDAAAAAVAVKYKGVTTK